MALESIPNLVRVCGLAGPRVRPSGPQTTWSSIPLDFVDAVLWGGESDRRARLFTALGVADRCEIVTNEAVGNDSVVDGVVSRPL